MPRSSPTEPEPASAHAAGASPPGTTIWLARHGEVYNPTQTLYGRLPRRRLSPEGERQARALSDFLADRPLAAIYCSPMLRARKTAAVIQARHPALRVRQDRDLLEVKTGWQGHTQADLEAIGWDFYTHRKGPDDDTLETVRDRMCRWTGRVLRRHAGEEVAAVSHGDPILVLVSQLKGAPLELWQVRPPVYIPTACVFRLRFDAQGRCLDVHLSVPHEGQAVAA